MLLRWGRFLAAVLIALTLTGCSVFYPLVMETAREQAARDSQPETITEAVEPPLVPFEVPYYTFSDRPFLLFDDDVRSREMSTLIFIELYDAGQVEDFSAHEYLEYIETSSEGEIHDFLASDCLAAERYTVERRAASIDGDIQPWSVLYIRVYYPVADTEAQRARNMTSYENDVRTIFFNCDRQLAEYDYRMVCVTSHYGDEMAIFAGYGIKDGTFLHHFDE